MVRRRSLADLSHVLRRGRHATATELFALVCMMLACFNAETNDGTLSAAGAAGMGHSGGGGTAAAAGTAGASSSDLAPPGNAVAQDMIDAHNSVRRSLDEPEPDVSWSEELAAYATDWAAELARGCAGIRHREQDRYGENIAMRGSSRVTRAFSPEEVVAGWAAESACWEFGTINGSERCDSACVGGLNSNGCGHYTQLVWRDTERVGCGLSTCENGYDYEIWVCNYDPPGNFIGEAPY